MSATVHRPVGLRAPRRGTTSGRGTMFGRGAADPVAGPVVVGPAPTIAPERPATDDAVRREASPEATPHDGTTAEAPSRIDVRREHALRGRDRYIDSLRVLALVRVVAYHLFGWAWLPLLFPSMGVMFALAGSLVAASLDRSPHRAGTVVRRRLRRLLPSYWAFIAVTLPAMVLLGWTSSEDATPLGWDTALAWVVPYVTPPSSELGQSWYLPLWYIATYLWLVLLSPALLWLYRRWPVRMVALPLLLVLALANGVLETGGGPVGDILLDVATFAACWMLGFAHHDGAIRRLALWKVAALAGACLAFGYTWAQRFPTPEGLVNISDIPVADAFYGFGFVLLLLRLYVDMSWMWRVRLLDRFVAAVNRRALTIYLWGNLSITLALIGLDRWAPQWTGGDPVSHAVAFGTSWLVIGVAVLAFGWVEDLAARRPRRGVGAGREAARIVPRPARDGSPSVAPSRP
ncbi:acyltransferase family protein [Agilicoccus flavus]|uniref:acyltransferase family protein n=1 Tax=Agilicoccus flavus TaxID=2775968 RepID=UPI001CF6AA4A|nr:acyltransferase [Agilicoccus flavus]